jgi:uncharacterized membrane protein
MDILNDPWSILIIAGVSLLIFFWILYEVIKAAIKGALNEKPKNGVHIPQARSEPPQNLTEIQKELMGKYDRGEITLEQYTNDWNK